MNTNRPIQHPPQYCQQHSPFTILHWRKIHYRSARAVFVSAATMSDLYAIVSGATKTNKRGSSSAHIVSAERKEGSQLPLQFNNKTEKELGAAHHSHGPNLPARQFGLHRIIFHLCCASIFTHAYIDEHRWYIKGLDQFIGGARARHITISHAHVVMAAANVMRTQQDIMCLCFNQLVCLILLENRMMRKIQPSFPYGSDGGHSRIN